MHFLCVECLPFPLTAHREEIASHKEDFFKRKLQENADRPE